MPTEKYPNGSWPHPARLPLGCGWTGHCTAPGHETEVPDANALEQFCNLGYAEQCGKLPRERAWDAVRFGITARKAESNEFPNANRSIRLRYVCERHHLPAEHGFLEFESASPHCAQPHYDERVQKMAECFVASYLEKIKPRPDDVPASSEQAFP
jgi:hypothetical protein